MKAPAQSGATEDILRVMDSGGYPAAVLLAPQRCALMALVVAQERGKKAYTVALPAYRRHDYPTHFEKKRNMSHKKIGLAVVFIWFIVGGIGHFIAPEFFVKIIPPSLPLRVLAVYVSGFFEILGALGLLHPASRRPAGIGLFALTIAVTPANVYMWLNPALFPAVPERLLAARLALQVALLGCIWWSACSNRRTPSSPSRKRPT